MEAEIKNAMIESTFLGREGHGIPALFIYLDYGDSTQTFGGWELTYPAYGIKFIMNIHNTLEVPSWEKLPGTYCRVKATRTKVIAIGHIIKDQWFEPEKLAEEIEEKN